MAYPYKQIFAVDESMPERVAQNGVVTIFAPGDTTKTPLTITSLEGLRLPNPIQVNGEGYGPPFMHATLSQVAWAGGGLSGTFESYEGMRDEAIAARMAAESAVQNAQKPTDESVDRGIERADIPTKVAQAVASEPAMVASAVIAVEKVSKAAGFIKDDDQRMGRIVDSKMAIPFGDKDGFIAGGFRADGRFEVTLPPAFPDHSFDSRAFDPKRGVGPLDPNTGFIFGAIDAEGYVSWGIRTDGTIHKPSTPTQVDARTQILAAGDSMVRGGTVAADGSGHVTWPYEDGWPNKLEALLGGVAVLNQGYGGRTVDDVRWHTGAMPIWVEFAGGVIPAAKGEYPVVVRQAVGTTAGTVGTFYGWVGGTNGNLKKLADGSWVFDKYNVTSAIPAPNKVAFERAGTEGFMDSTAIFWNGRNDVSFDIRGAHADVVEHVEASIAAQVAALNAHDPQFLVLSVTNRVQEKRGTANYEKVLAINERLRRRWPGQFIDIRTWLVNEAIHEAGLTPTAEDLENIADDAPPPQIMDQGTHYLKFIAPLIAAKLKTHLEERGYC